MMVSKIEEDIVNATSPIHFDEKLIQEITVNGEKGIWLNKSEIDNWMSDTKLSEYLINNDSNPKVILKKPSKNIEMKQSFKVSYLRPPTPPQPGEIIIEKEPNTPMPAAPPLIIRKIPERKNEKKTPLIVREAPPLAQGNQKIELQVINIPGKLLPPPPRKVIINREYYYINKDKKSQSKKKEKKTVSEKTERKSEVAVKRRASFQQPCPYQAGQKDTSERIYVNNYFTPQAPVENPVTQYYQPQEYYTPTYYPSY